MKVLQISTNQKRVSHSSLFDNEQKESLNSGTNCKYNF